LFNFIADRVRQRHFRDLTREVRAIARPTPEARPATMRGHAGRNSLQRIQHAIVTERPPGLLTLKN
jgi:hypothetical protein